MEVYRVEVGERSLGVNMESCGIEFGKRSPGNGVSMGGCQGEGEEWRLEVKLAWRHVKYEVESGF